eukprot:m.57146 g.57146  ORF g.57146 m.57146 type:complete len:223 (+) comp11083_c0_seq1:236-904(+)
MATQSVILPAAVYAKVILHACKHPTTALNGVLIGRVEKEEFQVTDCVPLFHSTLNLSPMLEVALLQLEQHYKKTDHKIIGYYQANESVARNSLDSTALAISEKLKKQTGNCVILLVNNSMLQKNIIAKEYVLKTYFPDSKMENGWALKPFNPVTGSDAPEENPVALQPNPPAAFKATSSLIQKKEYENLIDFEEHLEDVKLDWLNVKLGEKIKAALKTAMTN